jgi:hypothetical protein
MSLKLSLALALDVALSLGLGSLLYQFLQAVPDYQSAFRIFYFQLVGIVAFVLIQHQITKYFRA